MKTNHPAMSHAAYRDSGVDTDEAENGLNRLIKRITQTWPPRGSLGGGQLPLGYFAHVNHIGGVGVGSFAGGVRAKGIIAAFAESQRTIVRGWTAMRAHT